MISSELIKHFETLLSEKIISTAPLSGGDINEVYILVTSTQKVVVKINSASQFQGMFQAEAIGLRELKDSKTFIIPEVLHYGELDDVSFLLLEYIDSGMQSNDFWKVFGQQLAALHQNSRPYFGLETDNYIGSLPQYNTKQASASEFYITQRLIPQFKLAIQNGFSFSDVDVFYRNIENEIPNEKSSLVHGDLWNGNFMVDASGKPSLIDPAVAYAPREMDIGMMHLFGGFDNELFEVYHEVFPLDGNWKNRLPIWQLYYLLVHLNIFGSSYYKRVKSVLDLYS
ncbi:fructosamine kinase family protein [Aquimarina sp. MMG016]|uniref:fructosamine kinase family protein n=1 Tax=Aquimarina sp. MMG016 TaxID=2822690 RepID=UPI001B39EF7E|nr:fructosamine kinase family protein [Aquimarina sp. MMG016]MBQ4818519.1 fructosamine kinase family protein [Aquimarina sp. MMG016]